LPTYVLGNEAYWDFDEIVDAELDDDGKPVRFLIKWRGFINPVWETASVLGDTPEALYEFAYKRGVDETLAVICGKSKNPHIKRIAEQFVDLNPDSELRERFPSLFDINSNLHADPTTLTTQQNRDNRRLAQKIKSKINQK